MSVQNINYKGTPHQARLCDDILSFLTNGKPVNKYNNVLIRDPCKEHYMKSKRPLYRARYISTDPVDDPLPVSMSIDQGNQSTV